MRRIKRLTVLAGQFVRDVGGIEKAQQFVSLPPAPYWFGRGPRGGVYLATGHRTRDWSQDFGDLFIRDQWAVVDSSEGARYVRPGTRLYREAVES